MRLSASSYINDLSHGGIRFEKIENSEMIIKACKSVVKYIERKYPKQIENCQQNKISYSKK